jgi:hypothetical protein
MAVVGPVSIARSMETSGGGTYGGGCSMSGGGGGGSLSSSGSSSIIFVSTGPMTVWTILAPRPDARTQKKKTWIRTVRMKASVRLLFLAGSSIE